MTFYIYICTMNNPDWTERHLGRLTFHLRLMTLIAMSSNRLLLSLRTLSSRCWYKSNKTLIKKNSIDKPAFPLVTAALTRLISGRRAPPALLRPTFCPCPNDLCAARHLHNSTDISWMIVLIGAFLVYLARIAKVYYILSLLADS